MASELQHLEAKRQLEQDRLDSLKSSSDRNRLGQFATPYELASHIAHLAALEWEDRADEISFLDPGFGSGVFYSTLVETIPNSTIESARGIEIDPEFSRVARDLWARTGLEVIEGDFTQLATPSEAAQANLVICNPPYIRHHHLDRNRKVEMKKLVLDATGLSINGLAGMYCYYMLIAHRWLKPGGIGIWLIPSEFMDVNYGSVLRSYLSDLVTLLRIHRFETTDVQFTDALVSSVVVMFRNTKPPKDHEAGFSVGGKIDKPRDEYEVTRQWLKANDKWTRKPSKRRQITEPGQNELMFGDLFRTRRGLATGANSYFILTKKEAEKRRLPTEFLKPILPPPRYLSQTIIESDSQGFPILERQLVLIDCDLAEERVRNEYPNLWKYLKVGMHEGVNDRYLARKRSPWYRQERLKHTKFLCSYMGRSTGGRAPFRFFWNKSRATVANVYHLIYPRSNLANLLKLHPEFEAEVYKLLGEISLESMIEEGRTYGGGLHKIEPRELYRIKLTDIGIARELRSELMHT